MLAMLRAMFLGFMMNLTLIAQGSDGRVCDVRYAPLSDEWRIEVMYEEDNFSVTVNTEGEFRYITRF